MTNSCKFFRLPCRCLHIFTLLTGIMFHFLKEILLLLYINLNSINNILLWYTSLARPNITEFHIEDYYYSISNHSLSCSATFASNPTNDIKLEICLGNSFKSITDDPAFTLSQFSDVKTLEKCSHQKTVSYTFDFALVSNGTLLRCVAIDHNLNITITTLCDALVLRSPGTTNCILKIFVSFLSLN